MENKWKGIYRDIVPPSSPRESLNFSTYEPLPSELPNVKNLKIPYIKEIGVKATIDKLGDYFRCNKHSCNLLHFWFIDIIADCLWRAQDEFNLPESDQKIVLEWIIFLFNLIRGMCCSFKENQNKHLLCSLHLIFFVIIINLE